jgi:hypothetical protein
VAEEAVDAEQPEAVAGREDRAAMIASICDRAAGPSWDDASSAAARVTGSRPSAAVSPVATATRRKVVVRMLAPRPPSTAPHRHHLQVEQPYFVSH